MNKLARILILGLFAGLFAFATGCSDDDDNNGLTMPNDMDANSKIRVVHASPDAPPVDVYAAGESVPLFRNVEYGETTTYLSLSAGTYTIDLRPAGAPESSNPVYSTGPLTIPEETTITAIAAGLITSSAQDETFRVLPLVEGFDTAAGGSANVRIVHASPTAPAVAIDVGNDGTPEINNLDRFADTGAEGVALPSGTALQVGIWAGSPLSRVTAFTTPELPDGADLFVIATGLLDRLPRETNGFALLAVGPSGTVGFIRQNPVVYAFHASPDAPAVDIALSGTMTVLAGDLAFGDLSGPIQVAPGSYDLDVLVAGTNTVAAIITTPSTMAGERYLLKATGFVAPQNGGEPFQLVTLRDGFNLNTSEPLLRVVHSSPDAPAVDVGVITDGVFTALSPLTNLSFPAASVESGLAVPAATLSIGVAPTQTTDLVAAFTVTTAPGLKAFAIASGSLMGGDEIESFRLYVINTSVSPWTAAEITS
ncbi:MAG: DUF4397 domain-containing protein [Candidatus Eisenbacteria bacterium]|uniref:DUF4397 domain-containing protein n=1 Tax=Eiseniibacteriota bacterium TaxID=2212470 RepID=A0A948W3Y5_UNCEI|nr:DUF4397 domain-containing protein [Candidatus Eisenbacteria bacterium]MBU1948779.1 DUF4397 domain-containing protein [Candidatus Eisenbacteria bacterium]MBU2691612.1 DUF4397 domain-containing protein [Candidatus Eisenbacteria bacterium]